MLSIYTEPKSPLIELNPKVANGEKPQAWKIDGHYYYNFLAAHEETSFHGEKLPRLYKLVEELEKQKDTIQFLGFKDAWTDVLEVRDFGRFFNVWSAEIEVWAGENLDANYCEIASYAYVLIDNETSENIVTTAKGFMRHGFSVCTIS